MLQQLIDKVADLPVAVCHTDDGAAYRKVCLHIGGKRAGKANTWKIERKKLNFGTRTKRLQRKTICFSKNEQIQDNVIRIIH